MLFCTELLTSSFNCFPTVSLFPYVIIHKIFEVTYFVAVNNHIWLSSLVEARREVTIYQ